MAMDDNKNAVIGKNLKHIRRESGLSQPQLANLLHVTFQQIQKYEKGINRLPVTHLHFLKCHLDIPYEAFFEGLDGGVDPASRSFRGRVKHKLLHIRDDTLLLKIERIIDVLTD